MSVVMHCQLFAVSSSKQFLENHQWLVVKTRTACLQLAGKYFLMRPSTLNPDHCLFIFCVFLFL